MGQTTAEMYKHRRSSISCELVSRPITLVLLELISVRDGAFCVHQFDDNLVRSLIDCISMH